nr:MAG TPA: hypothetical protein [Caudoviricetes sp.]
MFSLLCKYNNLLSKECQYYFANYSLLSKDIVL